MKKLLLATFAFFCITTVHANPTEKQKIVDMVKSSDGSAKAYSSDGKRFYEKEYRLNDKGGVDVRVREKYLPAVTDGINRTPKSSYFTINPKTMKYISKAARGANAVGIGLLMIDVLGEGIDWALDPVNNTVQINNSLYYNWEVTNYLGSYQVSNTAQAKTVAEAFFKKVYGEQSNYVVHGCNFDSNKDISCTYNDNRSIAFYKSVAATQVMSEQELDTIIKDLAKSGNIHAKQVILDAAKDEIADGKHDSEIITLADDITQDSDTDTPTEEPKDNPTDDTTTDPKTDNPTDDKTDTEEPKADDKTNSELPPFCQWARPVCDFIDWVRQEPPQEESPKTVPKAGVGDIPELSDVDRYKERINFEGQCPTGELSFTIKSISYNYKIPYTHFCDLLEQLAPWLLAFTYLSTAYFVVSNL